jgi:exodeoxyribonuclease VII small subunit
MTNEPKESENYQTMLREVEGIVSTMSAPGLDLDDMVKNVERGYTLIKSMRERLDATKEKIENLRAEYTNTPGT